MRSERAAADRYRSFRSSEGAVCDATGEGRRPPPAKRVVWAKRPGLRFGRRGDHRCLLAFPACPIPPSNSGPSCVRRRRVREECKGNQQKRGSTDRRACEFCKAPERPRPPRRSVFPVCTRTFPCLHCTQAAWRGAPGTSGGGLCIVVRRTAGPPLASCRLSRLSRPPRGAAAGSWPLI